MTVLARLPIFLPIDKPQGDFELPRGVDNGHQLFNLIGGQFTGALVDVDFGLFANQIGKTTTHALNLGQGEDDIALALHVGVENTQNVLKFGALHQRRRPVMRESSCRWIEK